MTDNSQNQPDNAPLEDDAGSSVNPQIVDAVQQSTDFAFGLKASLLPPVENGTRLSSGAAIAFDKAAQAAALSIQDAADFARNVMSIAAVAQGKALAEILAGVNVENAQTAITQANTVITNAITAVGNLNTAQTKMLQAFSRA